MDGAGVDRAILVPPSWEGDHNDLVLDATNRYPDRFGAMGRLSFDLPRPERIVTWREQPGMLGVRLTFTRSTAAALTDGTADWFWPIADTIRLPIMVFAPGHTQELSAIAARYNGLSLIIDHLGLAVDILDADLIPLLQPLLALARYPNVAVKASALPCAVSEPFPFPSLHEPLRRVVDAFGPERVFWGSDFSRLPCTYSQAVSLFSEALDFLSDEDKTWILGRGLENWLNWQTLHNPGG